MQEFVNILKSNPDHHFPTTSLLHSVQSIKLKREITTCHKPNNQKHTKTAADHQIADAKIYTSEGAKPKTGPIAWHKDAKSLSLGVQVSGSSEHLRFLV